MSPCLRVVDGFVYPTLGLPGDVEACFEIVGTFVYVAGSSGAPWFRVETTEDQRADRNS